jgi:hypothetical protein
MRILIFLATILPAFLQGQINRSATELAKENIRGYLTHKIFKTEPYQPISYGELKPEKQRSIDARWSIEHKFRITETKIEEDKKMAIQKPYNFIFYLDDKMQVISARSYSESE